MPTIVKLRITSARKILRSQVPSKSGADANEPLGVPIYCEVRYNHVQPDTYPMLSSEGIARSEAFNFPSSHNDGTGSRLQDGLFEFETVDDDLLSSNLLDIRVFDNQSKEMAGYVRLDLSTLLTKMQEFVGWQPIYHIENGILGELHIKVTATVIRSQTQKTNNSIYFFTGDVPACLELKQIIGLIEEIIEFRSSVDKDRETQFLLQESAMRIRKKIQKAVIKRGGNAVVTYRQSIDHESGGELSDKNGERVIVVRAYGTAVIVDSKQTANDQPFKIALQQSLSWANQQSKSQQTVTMPENQNEVLLMPQDSMPCVAPYSVKYSSVVSARSVQILDSKGNERERTSWWDEIRNEISKSAHAIGCTHVLGYREFISIQKRVHVMTAIGTAVRYTNPHPLKKQGTQSENTVRIDGVKKQRSSKSRSQMSTRLTAQEFVVNDSPCSSVHLQNEQINPALNLSKLQRCLVCNKGYVPEVLLCTVDPPAGLDILGRPEFVQVSQVQVRDYQYKIEKSAKALAQSIFFLENQMFVQLTTKMKILGKNAIFGLKTSVTVTDSLVVIVFTGTACTISALPMPRPLAFKDPLGLLKLKDCSELRTAIEEFSLFKCRSVLSQEVITLKQQPIIKVSEAPQININFKNILTLQPIYEESSDQGRDNRSLLQPKLLIDQSVDSINTNNSMDQIILSEKSSLGSPADRKHKANKRGAASLLMADFVECYNDNRLWFEEEVTLSKTISNEMESNQHHDIVVSSGNYLFEFLRKSKSNLHPEQSRKPKEVKQPNFVVQLNDSYLDNKHWQTILDLVMPAEVQLLTTQDDLVKNNNEKKQKFYSRVFTFEVSKQLTSSEMNLIMQGAYQEMALDLIKQSLSPCIVTNLQTTVKIREHVLVFIQATILQQAHLFNDLAAKERKEVSKVFPNLTTWIGEGCQRNNFYEGYELKEPISVDLIPKVQQQNSKASWFGLQKTLPVPRQYTACELEPKDITISQLDVLPGKRVTEHFGLIDIHIVRVVKQDVQDGQVDMLIEKVITNTLKDLQDIMQARAMSVSANSVLGYKVEVSKLQCKPYLDSQKKVFLLISAMGDAVNVV